MWYTGTPSRTLFFDLSRTPCWTVFPRITLFSPPLFIGEVASAQSWRMTEGSVCKGDPSVSRIGKAGARATSLTYGRGGLKTKLEVRV